MTTTTNLSGEPGEAQCSPKTASLAEDVLLLTGIHRSGSEALPGCWCHQAPTGWKEPSDDDPGGVHECAGVEGAGWTITQIAKHLGYHPATIPSWLKAGGPPPKRSVPVEELVVDEHWQARIAALLAHNEELQALHLIGTSD